MHIEIYYIEFYRICVYAADIQVVLTKNTYTLHVPHCTVRLLNSSVYLIRLTFLLQRNHCEDVPV